MSRKMHILATCQYGWPEPYPSLYPMEEMAKRGHYVHAITGTPKEMASMIETGIPSDELTLIKKSTFVFL